MMSASKFCTPKAIRSVASKHSYAVQAKATGQESVPHQTTKVTKLPNGVTVTSVENYSPVSKIAVVAKAGSRYESNNVLGVSHALRNLSGYATQNASAFGIIRNLQQIGANLQTTSTREHMFYTMDCMRDKLDSGVKYLSEVALKPLFKQWEVNSAVNKLRYDLAAKNQCPITVVMDLVHKAAYRRGLGNSLYAPEYMVGKHSPDMLKAFVTSNMTPQNIALLGSGIEHDQLLEYANKLFDFEGGQDPSPSDSGYHGDELREEGLGNLAYVAVVTEGAGMKSLKDRLCLAVVQQALGTGPHVKWAAKDSGRLSKATMKATESPHAVSSINISYSDSGLFGFLVAAQSSEMDKVLKAVVGATSGLTKNALTDQEIKTAKKQVKAAMHFGLESSESILEDMAQSAFNEAHESPEQINAALESLTTSEIMTVAKKVITGKPSMAAVGNLTNTPYLDQL